MNDGSHVVVKVDKPISTWDGKKSIEHQLDIHVNDLMLQPDQFPVLDVLKGIHYVSEYRIKGGRMPHLDAALCTRLAKALLLHAHRLKKDSPWSLRQGFTEEAQLAMVLLLEFAEEVQAFARCLGDIPPAELRKKLRLGRRIIAPESPHDFAVAVQLLHLLTNSSQQLSDWQEFFPQEDVERARSMLDAAGFFKSLCVERSRSGIILPPPSLYFDRDPNRLLDMFQTNADTGLSEQQVAVHREYYGANVLPTAKGKSVVGMIASQFKDFMIVLLLVTIVVSAVVDWPQVASPVVLALVVLFNVAVGVWQEQKAKQALLALKGFTVLMARVVRDGKEAAIPARDLVPGDIVLLGEGDAVPADLRLFRATHLELIEAALTGESEPIAKSTRAIRINSRRLPVTKCEGNALMGCSVSRGTGAGIVVRTGLATEMGQINLALIEKPEEPSSLQQSLAKLGKLLVLVAVVLCMLIAGAGIAYGHDPVETVRVAASLGVSVIPEGLVAVMTLTMAVGVARLAKQNVLMRTLQPVEVIGGVTTVCVDKTGTITQGRMRVEQVSGNESLCVRVAAACCSASEIGGRFVGDPTEVALLEEAASRQAALPKSSMRLVENPFDSDRRMMSVVYPSDAFALADDTRKGPFVLLAKGACEAILAKCTRYLCEPDPAFRAIDEAFLAQTAALENAMSDQGLRVLATAIGFPPRAQEGDAVEEELVFVGLIGLVDPPRPDIAESIKTCHDAGISVIMITGDHLRTAIAIAGRVGIYNAHDGTHSRVMKGAELDVLSDEAVLGLDPFPVVFARVSPQHKLAIVLALKKRGETVSMTGDGVNDAPAIKLADVGIAMGQTGTQLTKDAADMILLDDSFSTIVVAIRYGRTIYANLVKFMVYLLACNSAEIWTVLGATLINVDVPFSATNILWANLIADVPPSLSLGLEQDPCEAEAVLRQRPRQRSENILGCREWLLIFATGLLLSALTMFVFLRPGRPASWPSVEHRSEAFFVMTGLQLLLALFSRDVRKSAFSVGFCGNRWLLAMVALSFACLLAGHYVPKLNEVLELRPIGAESWLWFGAASAVMIVGVESVKFIIRKL